MQLLINCVIIRNLTWTLEAEVGSLACLAVYLSGGVVGGTFSAALAPTLVGTGSAPAVYGLLGGLVGHWAHTHQMYAGKDSCAYIAGLLCSSCVGFAVGLTPYCDNFELIFGWLGGLFASLGAYNGSYLSTDVDDPSSERVQAPKKRRFVYAGCILLLLTFGTGIVVLLQELDTAKLCPVCKYFTCVETPWWDCDYTCVNGTYVLSGLNCSSP